MKFVIRDDDTNYHTHYETLEQVFGDLWDTVPVTLACIPIVSSTADVIGPEEAKEPRRISENDELVEYISEKLSEGKVEIALHGYSHKNHNGDPEFVRGSNLTEKVKRGKSELEDAFETTVNFFVPPHVRMSYRGTRAIRAANLHMIRGYGPKPREIQLHPKYLYSYSKIVAFYLRYGHQYRYPQPLNYGTHVELYSHRVNKNTDIKDLKEQLEYIRSKDGIFCISAHATRITKQGIRKLNKIVDYSRQYDVEYIRPTDILES